MRARFRAHSFLNFKSTTDRTFHQTVDRPIDPYNGTVRFSAPFLSGARRSTRFETTPGDHALNQIVIGVDHATRLAEQLLSLARLGPDFSQGDFVALALRGRVGEMFIELELRAANRDVTLINEVPVDLQLHANADAVDIALRNLLDNAIKHSASPGEVRVSARQCSPDFVELTIGDDGPGIPRDAHAQIPRRCTRLPGTLAPGSGLGLAIVARIAPLSGSVSVESAACAYSWIGQRA